MAIASDRREQERTRGLGGTDAAPILGVSRWKTALDVYLESIGEAPPREDDDWLYWGRILEAPIADEYARHTGRKIARVNRTLAHPDHPWMLANLDRRVIGERRLMDVKTVRYFNRDDWGEPGSDAVPIDVTAQMTHYLGVTGYEAADVAVLFMAERRFEIYTVERDDRLIERMIDIERAFWQRVEERRPPDPTTAADVRKLWLESSHREVEATPEVAFACQRIADLKAQRKAIDAEIDDCEYAVLHHMTDASELISPGGTVLATWRSQTSRRLDQKTLTADHPDLISRYQREARYRVFRLKVKPEENTA